MPHHVEIRAAYPPPQPPIFLTLATPTKGIVRSHSCNQEFFSLEWLSQGRADSHDFEAAGVFFRVLPHKSEHGKAVFTSTKHNFLALIGLS